MKVKQVSVFLENKRGRLLEALRGLEAERINIRALSLADTLEFGVLRLIVNDPDKARKTLEKRGFTVGETEVIAIGVDDRPGGLASVLEVFQQAGIDVEYLYAFVEKKKSQAVVVFRIEKIAAGLKALKAAGVKVLASEEIYRL